MLTNSMSVFLEKTHSKGNIGSGIISYLSRSIVRKPL
mgnify:CR=1 FL=1